jgi:hypothetical protein
VDPRRFAVLAAEALEETLTREAWPPGASSKVVCRMLEVFCVWATTHKSWTRVGDANFIAQHDGSAMKATADALVYGPNKSRWKAPSQCLDSKFTTSLGWYTYGGLDLVWVLIGVMRCAEPGFIRGFSARTYGVCPRDLRIFFGPYATCSYAFKNQFTSLSCDDVVEILEVAGFALNAPPERERTLEWVEEACYAVRALEDRARILAAFEHEPELVGETYALSDLVGSAGGGGESAAAAAQTVDAVIKKWEEEDDIKRAQEDKLAEEREGDEEQELEDAGEEGTLARDAALAAQQKLAQRRKQAADARELQKKWVRHGLDAGDEEEDEDESRKRRKRIGGDAEKEEEEEERKRIAPPRSRAGMRFVTEVRALTAHLHRSLAESEALENSIEYPELTKRERLALKEMQVWMVRGLDQMNAAHTRNTFRAFVAQRVVSPGDFVLDSVRNELTPSKTALDLITRRGDVAGDADTEVCIIPSSVDPHAASALHFQRDYADFALHRLTAQIAGSSVVDCLVGKFPPSAHWYEGAGRKVFWDGARGAYFWRGEGAAPHKGFASVTECVMYVYSRGLVPLQTSFGSAKCDMRDLARFFTTTTG